MAGEAEGLAVPAPSVAPSLAARFAALPAADRASALAELSDEEVEGLNYDWRFWARPSQLPPEGQTGASGCCSPAAASARRAAAPNGCGC